MYFLKTQGTNKIPNYIQIRDDHFVLLAHFRMDNPDNQIKKFGLEHFIEEIKELISNTAFGELKKIEK